MKSVLNAFAGTLLAIVVITLIIAGAVAVSSVRGPKIKDHSWLVLELYGDLPEYDPPTGVMGEITGGDVETLTRVLDNLEKAWHDDRIDGVILKVAWSFRTGMASMQEIRGAIQKLQGADKRVIGWAETLRERQYFLIAACDEVVVPQNLYFPFTGFSLSTPHIKGTLDKLGIKPNLSKIKDYKAAAELLTREEISGPVRENDEWLLEERWQMFMEAMASDRGLSEQQVVALMERAGLTAEEAAEDGLVDRVAYWDEIENELKRDEDELQSVSSSTYSKVKRSRLGLKGKKTIAVIHAQGTIVGRKNGVNPLLGITMGSESLVAEFRRARTDDDVAAIVFRVDSGGGDASASEPISRAVDITTELKPVVVSMVDVAASGGYDIAYRSSRILADPGTITGSIGSIAAKFNMAGLYDKLGLSHSHVTKGPMALIDASDRDFSEQEWRRFEELHWAHFNQWLSDVAERRGMSFEEAERLAHGRVWTGRQAAENGLIDELGGLDRAVEVAKELAGIPATEGVKIEHFPERMSLLASLFDGGDGAANAARWVVYRMIHDDLAATLELVERNPQLLMAPGR
jgi:protease-4